MSTEGIQFDEDNLSTASRVRAGADNAGMNSGEPAMVRWLMSHGLAKSPAMAQGILIGVIVAVLIVTYLIIS